MKKRIYLVSTDDRHHLVRAVNRAQAIRHIAERTITCRVAEQDDLVNLVPEVPVENANAQEQAQ